MFILFSLNEAITVTVIVAVAVVVVDVIVVNVVVVALCVVADDIDDILLNGTIEFLWWVGWAGEVRWGGWVGSG